MKSMSTTSLYACGILQTLSVFVSLRQAIQLHATREASAFCVLEEEIVLHPCLLHHPNIVFPNNSMTRGISDEN